MGLITYKPTTPSYRKTVKIDKSQLFKGRPEKSLIEDLQPNSGRNNTGKITIRHRSGGHKKKYRLVNFKRNIFDKIGKSPFFFLPKLSATSCWYHLNKLSDFSS